MALQSDGKVVTAGFGEERVYMPPYFIYLDTWSLLTRNEAMAAPVCSAAPRGDCGSSGGSKTSSLKLSRRRGKAPTLKWSWKKGTATAADFGDPTTGGSYALCVYDGTNALVGIAQVEGAGLCGGKPVLEDVRHDRLAVQRQARRDLRRRPGEAQDRHRQGRPRVQGEARQPAHRAAAGDAAAAHAATDVSRPLLRGHVLDGDAQRHFGLRREELIRKGTYNVFKYSMIARRSSSVSTALNSSPVFFCANMWVLKFLRSSIWSWVRIGGKRMFHVSRMFE